MALNFESVDLSKIAIGPIETGNNGGKYMRFAFNGEQFKNIQLGASVQDTMRCKFGAEPVAVDQPTKLCIKMDVTEKVKAFIVSIDDKVKAAVNDESMNHRSTLREGTQNTTLKLKILPETQVFTTTLKDNKMTQPKSASTSDITPNCQVLPIIKIQGGVYFIEGSYGTSMVATQVLVVNGEKTEEVPFALGNDVMICDE